MKSLEEQKIAAMAIHEIPMQSSKRQSESQEEVPVKKKRVSQGVKALEKASKRGMKDMRSFFKKNIVHT